MNKLFFGTGKCPICEAIIRYKAFVIVSPWVREKIKTKKNCHKWQSVNPVRGLYLVFAIIKPKLKNFIKIIETRITTNLDISGKNGMETNIKKVTTQRSTLKEEKKN